MVGLRLIISVLRMAGDKLAKAEKIAALTVSLFALCYLLGGSKLQFLEEFGPGPGFFPVLLGITLLALSVAHFLSAKKSVSGGSGDFHPRQLLRPAAVMVALCLSAFVLEFLGFLITVFLLVFLVLVFLERYRAPVSALLAICISGGFYLLFETWLKVPLPQGFLINMPF